MDGCCRAPRRGGIGVIADLKVTMRGTRPLVNAKINGGEVSLIADSGAFYSVLSEGTVAQFKLANHAGQSLFGRTPKASAAGNRSR